MKKRIIISIVLFILTCVILYFAEARGNALYLSFNEIELNDNSTSLYLYDVSSRNCSAKIGSDKKEIIISNINDECIVNYSFYNKNSSDMNVDITVLYLNNNETKVSYDDNSTKELNISSYSKKDGVFKIKKKFDEDIIITFDSKETTISNNNSKLKNIKCSSKNNLYNFMCKNSLGIDSNLNINYSLPSSEENGRGIYTLSSSINESYPVFFYRGNVDNNSVVGNLCYKIIRTTETGGVKIIYNGEYNNSCNNTGIDSTIGKSIYNKGIDNAYLGYMYGKVSSKNYSETHANNNNSVIKNMIDNWYEDNIKGTNVENMLDTFTIYCADRSINNPQEFNLLDDWSSYGILGYGLKPTIYSSYARVGAFSINAIPSLNCNENDSFSVNAGNKSLSYPVALITIDEVSLAGGRRQYDYQIIKNNDYYLYNGIAYWTMSPAFMEYTEWFIGTTDISTINNNGFINSGDINNSYGVRPVITLSNDVKIKSGSGTTNDPYILE